MKQRKRTIEKIRKPPFLCLLVGLFYCNCSPVFAQSNNDTTRAGSYLKAGVLKYRSGDLNGALQDARNAILINNLSAQAFKLKGDIEFKLNQHDSSISSYSQALKINPQYLSALFGKADSERLSDKYDSAISDYTKALQFSKDCNLLYGRGACYYFQNLYSRSISDISGYLNRCSSKPAYLIRGASYYYEKNYRQAIRDLTRYEKLGGGNEVAFYCKGQSYLKLSGTDKKFADSAEIEFKKIIKNSPDNLEIIELLGICYNIKKDTLQARKYLQRAIDIDPEVPDFYFHLGDLEWQLDHNKKAIDLYQLALAKKITPTVEIYIHLADAEKGLRDTANAVRYYSKAIELDSNYADAYEYKLDLIAHSVKFTKESIHDLTSLIRLYKDDLNTVVGLYTSRAWVNAFAGNYKNAKIDGDKAVSLDKNSAFAHLMRAFLSLFVIPDPNRSRILKDVDIAIKLDGKRWDAYFLKALALRQFEKDLDQQCELVKKALSLGGVIDGPTKEYFCNPSLRDSIKPEFEFGIFPEPFHKKDESTGVK